MEKLARVNDPPFEISEGELNLDRIEMEKKKNSNPVQ